MVAGLNYMRQVFLKDLIRHPLLARCIPPRTDGSDHLKVEWETWSRTGIFTYMLISQSSLEQIYSRDRLEGSPGTVWYLGRGLLWSC